MYNRMLHHSSGPYSAGNNGSSVDDVDRVDVRDLFRKVWRRKWIVIASMVIVALLAGLAVSQVTPRYTSLSQVMLDPRKSQIIADTAVVSDLDISDQVVNSETAVLSSNVLIEAVINEIGFEKLESLDPSNKTPSLLDRAKSNIMGLFSDAMVSEPLSAEALKAEKTERLVSAIGRTLSVRREGDSFVISILVETESPVLSMLLASTIADQYISAQLAGRQDMAQRATAWIEERVSELRAEVEEAETAVGDYRATSLVLEGSSIESASQQLFELSNRLALARADRTAAQARYKQLTDVIAAEGLVGLQSIVTSPLMEAFNEQKVALLRKDAVWAERYDANHSVRKRLASEIAQIEEDLTQEISKIVEVRRSEVETARILETTMEVGLKEMEQRVIEISGNALGLRELERKAAASRQTYEELLSRLTETRSQEQLQKADAKIIERATIPGAPSSPRPKLMVAMGGMTGAALGLGLVFFLELSSTTFRSQAEIERETGLPVLASIPVGKWKTPRAAVLELGRTSQGIYAECIRHLRTALLMRNGKNSAHSILVTSSVPMEGKTTTTLALAQMSALAGKSVIVVDCDFRRSPLQEAFGWQMDYDLADFIRNECTLGDAIHSDENLDFDVLASTDALPLAVDELSEAWLKPMLNTLKKFYDVVLVDAPPLLAVSDALILSQAVDSTIYLVRWDSTARSAVKKGLSSLAEMGTGPAGIVMTMVDPKNSTDSYAEEYGYNA